jgi:hypothetical protein
MMKQSRILYLCLFFAALIFIYFYGGKVPYMFFYTIVLLPLVSLFYTTLIYFRFKYGQDTDKKFVTKGDKVNFIFSINNEDFFLYPYIRVTFYGSKTIFANQFQVKNFSLFPFRGKSFGLELQCNYRGNYEIGINSVEIEDFLGLFKFKYNVFEPKYVTVYPRIVSLDRFFLKTDFMSESHSVLNSKNEDMSTIEDIRKYAYGDSLKRIHWKLTARSRNLMVKKFQSTSETSALMILDLHKNSYNNGENIIIEDKVIESIVSVLHYCLYNWIPVNLIYYSGRVINVHAKNHLMFNEIYEMLAKIKFNVDIPVKDLIEVYVNSTISKTNILIFTSNLDYELYNQIYKTSTSGYDVSLIYTSPENLTGVMNQDVDNILSSLPEIGVNTYKLDINDDIKCILER